MTPRRIIGCALPALLLAVAAPWARADHRPLLQAHTVRDDFQGDGLGRWASYPPAQDIGYEPSLSPATGYDAPGGRAIMRVVRPNLAGPLRFGFIKKTPLAMSAAARLRFAYRLNGRDASIEIGLAGGDGRRYMTTIPASAGRWAAADVPLGQLRGADGRSPAPGVRIQAIYLVAHVGRADPDLTYRFLLDDVALSADREARFEVTAPPTVAMEPWAALVSAHGYGAGEKLAIEARAPSHLARVDCAVKSAGGRAMTTQPLYDDGTHGDRRAGDGVWSNGSVYTLRGADPTGVWVAQLQGMTADGRRVDTPVRFVVRPAGASDHPRLYFGAAGRDALSARAGKLADLWAHVQTTAKNARASGDLAHGGEVFDLLDREYLLPSLPAYFDVLNRARARISHNALVGFVTGDAEARASARSALLDVARWRRWVPPWFEAHGQHTYYPAGLLAADVALGYDLLYDDLADSERALVRRALVEQSIIPTYKEYVVDNRLMANTSNWLAHTLGGALIAAAAIAGEVTPADAGGRFEIYLNGLLLKLEDHLAASFLPDGSYGEGISYHEFDVETLAPALCALNRACGIDYWGQTHVLDSLTYGIYTLGQPVSASLDMGDTHPPAGHGLPALVYRSHDPVVRWYYEQFNRPSLGKFIFHDDSVAPRPPAQFPTSRVFMNKGNAVLRGGWGAADALLLFRAGPTFNHNHADQGSFLLSAWGEKLVTEAGWSDYYKDPHYATFFTQAIGHNTVLVDGNPESQTIADTPQFAALNAYPRLTDWLTSEFFDAVGSELSPVYGGRLEHYTRRIVYMKPHYFVVFDDLAVKGEPARLDWLLHLPDRARIQTAPGLALYAGRQAALAARVLAPAGAEPRVKDGHVPFGELATRTPKATPPPPAFLELRAAAPARAGQFLVALTPARSVEEARARAARQSSVTGNGWVGVRTERGEERDLVMFRAGGPGGEARHGEWMTDAAAWALTQVGERVKLLAVQQARRFMRAGRALFTSEHPAGIAASYGPGAIEVTCFAATRTKLRLFVGDTPAGGGSSLSAQLDGREVAAGALSYDRAEGMLSVTVPAGQHRLKIAPR